ncbi:MAG TPA: carbohydrate ABC transporter permease [Candidatus Methylomirabilis sp.]|nr:carbohydrate ABC transporter permease [Candidatus Methylomirabilis sp.]
MSSERPRRRGGRALGYAAAAILLAVTLFPVLWLAQISLKTDVEAMRVPPALFFAPTLDNYAAVFQGKFARSFGNSLIVSVSTTLCAMLLGVPAAYALSRASFGRSRGLALWVLTTRMAPPIAFAIPFFLAYRWLGLIDTLSGLLIIYLTFNLSLVMWMMRTFFDGIPRSLEEAAAIDGAGPLQAFRRITLPLSGPGLATTAIFCFVFAWNDFFYALVLTRSRALMAPVAIVNFMNYEGWEWGKIGAAATMIMVPVVLFALTVRRYLIRGLTAGALKG